jgi:hypothetical protein
MKGSRKSSGRAFLGHTGETGFQSKGDGKHWRVMKEGGMGGNLWFHSSLQLPGESGEGDKVVSGVVETQKVCGLAVNPAPARFPLSSWSPSQLVLKKVSCC